MNDDFLPALTDALAAHGFQPVADTTTIPDARLLLKRQTWNTNRAIVVVSRPHLPEDLRAYLRELRWRVAFRCGFFPIFWGIGIQVVIVAPGIWQGALDPARHVARIDNQWAIIQSLFLVDPVDQAFRSARSRGQFVTGKFQDAIDAALSLRFQSVRPTIEELSAKTGLPNFETVQREARAILELDLQSDESRQQHEETVMRALRHMDAQIETVRRKANGYPARPISAEVWISGAGYADLACALTEHFRTARWLAREENASALWAKATLAVCSHYHHLVGPAMLANADCHDRLGNLERSSQMYAGIIKDFAFFLERWIDETEAPGEETRISLESLQTAVERLVARGTARLDSRDLVVLQSQIASVLSRPAPEDNT
jgi:hypothetical protein